MRPSVREVLRKNTGADCRIQQAHKIRHSPTCKLIRNRFVDVQPLISPSFFASDRLHRLISKEYISTAHDKVAFQLADKFRIASLGQAMQSLVARNRFVRMLNFIQGSSLLETLARSRNRSRILYKLIVDLCGC